MYERGTPVMVAGYTDQVKRLTYFKCPMCGDEVAVRVEAVEDESNKAAVKE